MDQTTITGKSREIAKTLSFSEDPAIGYKLGFIGEHVSGCTAFAADQTLTMSESSASKMTSTESQEIVVNNLSGDSTHGYFFYPTMYVTRDGTYKVSHASGTDHPVGATWWKDVYTNADPALNLPLKFRSPGGASCESAAAAEGDDGYSTRTSRPSRCAASSYATATGRARILASTWPTPQRCTTPA